MNALINTSLVAVKGIALEVQAANSCDIGIRHLPSALNSSSNHEFEDPNAARKLQKAVREKVRRDRLNEKFIELGKTLDADRPKYDKAAILTDAIQLLTELTAEVSKLKAEFNALTEECRELNQEKIDLKDERVTLETEMEDLNVQYQHKLKAVFPWFAMDHSVLSHPPLYPFAVPIPVPSAPIPMHPSMQPYPFFGSQNAAVFPNPGSTFAPYVVPNTLVEQQSAQYPSSSMKPGNRSHISCGQDSRKSSDHHRECPNGNTEDSNDVPMDLELKTPGSTSDEDASSRQNRSKKLQRKGSSVKDTSSASRCSSSSSVQASSSNSVVGGYDANG
ncbi:hypothetical protein Nepgr_018219 [Nepenthes gracilis]|uniref:BHLH domain-containing protein n=1 Tax=Nepenthes gracilis TaxID=150966 RepID=A0AAD3XT92_NEPGR|nr:hypothetical protein Nepgr_018219 [Nepenthes gracilis]